MSYKAMLGMRCNVLQIVEHMDDDLGMPYESWDTVQVNIRCYLDLNYLRAGKDPRWTPETGTAENRAGTLFMPRTILIEPGNRIQLTKGPLGTFEIKSVVDEAWTPRARHHLECYVQEIDRALTT